MRSTQCSSRALQEFHSTDSAMIPERLWDTIALIGLVLGGIGGFVAGPWVAVLVTLLYGLAVLSALRSF